MTGNYTGTPHTNFNYPQNPQNNARKGGESSGQSSPQGDKFTMTSQKGEKPLEKTMPSLALGLGRRGGSAGGIARAPVGPGVIRVA